MIGSSARDRLFQACQSVFTFRQTRLTVSDRSAEQGGERPANTAGVGAGQIGRSDQRVGGLRPPLIGAQALLVLRQRLWPRSEVVT